MSEREPEAPDLAGQGDADRGDAGRSDANRNAAVLELLDYRRRVHELYARVRRAGSGSPAAHADFRATRDELFARHPQSPLPAERRASFAGLAYYAYDPRLRFVLRPDLDVERTRLELRLPADGVVALERFARVRVPFPAGTADLSLYWIGGYGGGVFLPFRDATNGDGSYGGGRYLLDTIKGADLGAETAAAHGAAPADRTPGPEALAAGASALVLDFNYAYHPSCAYDPRWDCPLAPPENRLTVPVAAGERLPADKT